MNTPTVPIERVTQSILILRGHRVLLDSDLAALYGVATARLNQQVRRNLERFPGDFMFQLTDEEHAALMLQFATSKPGRGGRRKLPLAFTEHGAIMAATTLNSPRAVEMSIYVVRAFVQLRRAIPPNTEVAHKLTELERKLNTHDQVITGTQHYPCSYEPLRALEAANRVCRVAREEPRLNSRFGRQYRW